MGCSGLTEEFDDIDGSAPKKKPNKRKGPRPPKPMTYDRLEWRAMNHISRFACSEEELRRVLVRAIRRNERHHPLDDDKAEEVMGWVTTIIEKVNRLDLLNDENYAAMRARSAHGQGKGVRSMKYDLARRGVGEDDIAAAIRQLTDEVGVDRPEDADLLAAIDFVVRRKIGPLRKDDELRLKNRNKDMQAMARRGFGLDIIRRVFDARDESDLDLLRQSVVQNM